MRGGLGAVEELEAADADGVVVVSEVIAEKAGFEGSGSGIGVAAVGGEVVAAEAELALCGDRGHGVVREEELGALREFGLPVDAAEALGEGDAEELVEVGVDLRVGGGGEPLGGVDAGAVVEGEGDGGRRGRGVGRGDGALGGGGEGEDRETEQDGGEGLQVGRAPKGGDVTRVAGWIV